MSRSPEHDERLADWVDNNLSAKERDRFEAELRVNPALAKAAAEYRAFVERMQRELQFGFDDDCLDEEPSQDPAGLTERIMAGLPEPKAKVHRFPMVASIAAAAAITLLYFGMRSLPRPEAEKIAESSKFDDRLIEEDSGAVNRGQFEAMPAEAPTLKGTAEGLARDRSKKRVTTRQAPASRNGNKALGQKKSDKSSPSPKDAQGTSAPRLKSSATRQLASSGISQAENEHKEPDHQAKTKRAQPEKTATAKSIPAIGQAKKQEESKGTAARTKAILPSATQKPVGPATGGPGAGGPGAGGPGAPGPSTGGPGATASPRPNRAKTPASSKSRGASKKRQELEDADTTRKRDVWGSLGSKSKPEVSTSSDEFFMGTGSQELKLKTKESADTNQAEQESAVSKGKGNAKSRGLPRKNEDSVQPQRISTTVPTATTSTSELRRMLADIRHDVAPTDRSPRFALDIPTVARPDETRPSDAFRQEFSRESSKKPSAQLYLVIDLLYPPDTSPRALVDLKLPSAEQGKLTKKGRRPSEEVDPSATRDKEEQADKRTRPSPKTLSWPSFASAFARQQTLLTRNLNSKSEPAAVIPIPRTQVMTDARDQSDRKVPGKREKTEGVGAVAPRARPSELETYDADGKRQVIRLNPEDQLFELRGSYEQLEQYLQSLTSSTTSNAAYNYKLAPDQMRLIRVGATTTSASPSNETTQRGAGRPEGNATGRPPMALGLLIRRAKPR